MPHGLDWTILDHCDVQYWLRLGYKRKMAHTSGSLQRVKLFHAFLLDDEHFYQHCHLLRPYVDPIQSIQISRYEHQNITCNCCHYRIYHCSKRARWLELRQISRSFNLHDRCIRCFLTFRNTFCGLYYVQNERLAFFEGGKNVDTEAAHCLYYCLRSVKHLPSSGYFIQNDEIVWKLRPKRLGWHIMLNHLRSRVSMALLRSRFSSAPRENVWACLFQDNI